MQDDNSKEEDNFLEQIDFVMLAAIALHRYGASADRIENASKLVSDKLGLEGNFFSIPTGIFASFRKNDLSQMTRLERLEPGGVNLNKYCEVDHVIDRVLDHSYSVKEGRRVIKATEKAADLYNTYLINFSYAIIGASIAIFVGGNVLEAGFSFFLGLMVGFFSQNIKIERIDSISDALTAFAVSGIVMALLFFGLPINPKIIILSSLIVLIPGLTLTTALMELANQNLTSGTARLMGSVIGLFKLSFGAFMATKIGIYFGVEVQGPYPSIQHPLWLKSFALLLASIGFIISFQARSRDSLWIILCCFISFWTSYIAGLFFDPPSTAFTAGCSISMLSNFLGRTTSRPTLVFLLPAIILLVPGSLGYSSLGFLYSKDFMAGLDQGFSTLAIAVGLVSGVYVGNILIRPKRTL